MSRVVGAAGAVRERVLLPVRRMPRTSRLIAGVGALGLVLGTGLVPVPCPFLLLTGLNGPFCGGSRMIGAMLTGDVGAALGYNAFALVVVVPLVLVVLAAMARRELGLARRHWPAGQRGRALGLLLVSALLAWTVVRNLPFEPFMALRA